MGDLAIAGAVGLDQDVAVDEGLAVARVVDDDDRVLAVHQVELAVAGLDPVVAHHEARGAVLQVVAAGAGAERPETIPLKDDPQSGGVGVVFIDAAHVAVPVNEVALDPNVLGCTVEDADEQPVSRVVQVTVPDDEMFRLLDVDRRRIGRVSHRGPVVGP